MLLEMPGHHGEVWACTVSSRGDMVVTGEQVSRSTVLYASYSILVAGWRTVRYMPSKQKVFSWWRVTIEELSEEELNSMKRLLLAYLPFVLLIPI
jgi:hypothetical protein